MISLGRGYRRMALIRRGGSVSVYDAWSDLHGCHCVAKVPGASATADDRRALRQEASRLLSLAHPHIVRALDLVERPGLALILEPLPGETLARVLRRGPLTPRDTAMLGVHLCSALHYLHRRGLLHLDLKPSNVICHGGIARLIDLGIARPPGAGERGIGSADYLAPEQARGGELVAATDVFGLGAVLFHAAVGRPPFDSDGDHDRYEQLARTADPVRRVAPTPAALARVIDACLAPGPRDRPDVAVVARRLLECAGRGRSRRHA